jgi:ketosteroid isomerase-like protein
MAADDWVRDLFERIDARDTEGFLAFLAEDASFRFGNQPPVQGKPAIRAAVSQFFDALAGLRHAVSEVWVHQDAAICHGTVTYTRRSGSEFTVPFADIFRLKSGMVHEYLVFIDISELHSAD